MKKKVLFFTTGMTAGGAERVIAILSSALSRRGHKVVIAMLKGDTSEYPLEKDVCLSSARLEPGLKSLSKAIRFFREVVVREQPDIIVSFSTKSDLIALIARKLYSLRAGLIVSDRADPYSRKKRMQLLCNLLYRSADAIVCQSENVATYYRRRIRASKIRVISNPLNESSIGSPRSTNREPIVLSVGRLSEQKNHRLAISVFSALRENRPELRMKIFGEGPLHNSLQGFIEESGLVGIVSLEGVAQNVLHANENASLFLFTSTYEGYPNALLEAVATGLPVVTSDFSPGTAKNFIDNSVNGYIVQVGDKDAHIDACERALSGQLNSAEILKNAKKARADHSVEQILKSWLILFDEIPA